MSLRTNSDPSTTSCTCTQHYDHICCGRANDNHPMHVNGDATSSICIQNGDHNGDCPSANLSSHSMLLNDATSSTCIQNDEDNADCPNDSPPHHVNDDAASSTCIQDGNRNSGCPSDVSSHLSDDATSSTCTQNDECDVDCPNYNPPHHIHVDDDAISSTCVGDQDGDDSDDKPPSILPTFCSICKTHDHYRIRCGCPSNDSHPMHVTGALHHHWCSQCIKYCFKDVVCDKPLPMLTINWFAFTISNGRDM